MRVKSDSELSAIRGELKVITNALFHLLLHGYNQMATLDELMVNVEKLKTASASIRTLLTNIKTKLDSCGTDPVKLAELSATIGNEAQSMTDAVVANTPAAEPAPTPAPPTEPGLPPGF